jgi:methylglutaconyl-CoA hydratase
MDQHAIITEIQGTVARVWLNRPDSRNAINMAMVEEFTSSLRQINANPAIRIISLRGRGPSFCAGADLDWMRQASGLSREENFKESSLLARCFYELYGSPKITLTGVHGVAFGGALGLVTACDLAVASESCVFAFSEVNLGLVPAAISPYVILRADKGKIMEYLLTGRKFGGMEAASLGVVNRCVPDEDFEQALEDLLAELLCAAPSAQLTIKGLIRSLAGFGPDTAMLDQTASLLAETRVSDEAKEGIHAFLEKRRPGWMKP